jgi:hypothetical protein
MLSGLLREMVGDYYYADFYEALKPNFEQLKAKGYDGVINFMDEMTGEKEYVVFDSNQAKLTTNTKPTANKDIRYSLSEDTALADKAISANESLGFVPNEVMESAKALREFVANRLKGMKDNGVAIPDDIKGSTAISNSSYDITEENTTVCIRSMAADALCDAVAEHLGRPLTVQDTLRISQDLMNYTDSPECVYCYVATDRRAYREFLGSYYQQMQSAIEALQSGKSSEEVYQAFLDGRKDTKNMRSRFAMWQGIANGGKMISASDLASEKMMQEIGQEIVPKTLQPCAEWH